MTTFMFRSPQGTVECSTAVSMNGARDKLADAYPDKQFHDAAVWRVWECWMGGKCVWHMTDTGECVEGPRPQ